MKQQWEKEIEEIKDELLDLIDEYFPKIKPQGVNKGRGESAVIVGTAIARFKKLLAKQFLYHALVLSLLMLLAYLWSFV